jgi:hypothetical protein
MNAAQLVKFSPELREIKPTDAGMYRVFQNELYNFESLYTFIQRT